MSKTLAWISGASSGIGRVLAAAPSWEDTRVIDISRSGAPGLDHVEADLADPGAWTALARSFQRELEGGTGDRVIFVHAATGMQEHIRETSEEDFPDRGKFVELHRSGELAPADRVAAGIWELLERGRENGSVVDLRKLSEEHAG